MRARDPAGAGSGPSGRLSGIAGGETGEACHAALDLSPGPLRHLLTVEGLPLEDLPGGTRLRVGASAVVEIGRSPASETGGGAPAGGLLEPDGEAVPAGAWVVSGGTVQVDDPVVLESVRVPLEDALDLHTFPPAEIPAIVGEYLEAARAAGLTEVRIVHGRGRGVQREAVRRVLARAPLVAGFADAPPERGGWGATVVRLRPDRGGSG